jgi:phosphoadenosine phosphosulfate reductase
LVAALPFVEAKNGVLYCYPLADWSSGEVARFEASRNVPQHPLALRGYRSVGNRFDTARPSGGAKYEKDGRHNGEKSECGLHTWWLTGPREDYGVRVVEEWSERVRSPLE